MLRVAFFLLFVVVLVGSAGVYVARRAAWLVGLGQRGYRALNAVLAAGLFLFVASRVLERRLPGGLLEPLGVAGAMISVGVLIAAILLAVVDLVALTLRGAHSAARRALPLIGAPRPSPIPVPAAPPEGARGLSRRGFLTRAMSGSALAVGASSAVYGTLIGRHDYVLEEISVRIPGLSRRLDGFTLVQLSDIHLGLFVGEPEMRAAEDLVRRARPDLVVLTGDLLDHEAAYAPSLGRLVTRLAALSRGGVIAVPGNHDYYAGIEAVLSTLAGAGAVVLRNSGLVIGDAGAGFALLGVDDPAAVRYAGRAGPDLGPALAAVPESADLPRVLLCHNPSFFPAVAGRVALQLSGHTHGGQINVGVRPADLVLGHPFIAGAYERAGSRIYVNRGFGTAGPPTRVGAAPEVTRIVLTA